mmetsp:Transcript_27442/g.53943  ORF Transcript_27442/g.53943 Transcript_27442/m.53943 type:complete len:190 (-) Transcript_27442:365-934(-)
MERAGVPANTVTYNALIYGCTREPARALGFFRRMKLRGVRPNTRTVNYVLNSLSRDPVRSEEVFREMLDLGLRPNDMTWKNLARTFARCPGKVEEMKREADSRLASFSRPNSGAQGSRRGSGYSGGVARGGRGRPGSSRGSHSSVYRRDSHHSTGSSTQGHGQSCPPGHCRNFFNTGHCRFGEDCKFKH